MGHLLAAVILLVCTDLLQASKPFHLKEKTLIVEVDYTNRKTGEIVTIECNTTAYTNAAIDSKKIQWSKKGHRGKTLTVQVSESPDAKNYTCALENIGIIDYTHIVLHNVNQPFYRGILNVENPISCMMKNYSGHFTCSWNGTKDYSNLEFFFEAFSNNSSLSCERIEKHITEGNAIPSYTVNCHDTQTCHYSEDPSIFVELHVFAKNRYEQHKKSFTLRNIIKPDPPQDLHIHKAAKNLSLQWEYPKTWCSSHLFYQLMFNVKVERKNSKKDVVRQFIAEVIKGLTRITNSSTLVYGLRMVFQLSPISRTLQVISEFLRPHDFIILSMLLSHNKLSDGHMLDAF